MWFDSFPFPQHQTRKLQDLLIVIFLFIDYFRSLWSPGKFQCRSWQFKWVHQSKSVNMIWTFMTSCTVSSKPIVCANDLSETLLNYRQYICFKHCTMCQWICIWSHTKSASSLPPHFRYRPYWWCWLYGLRSLNRVEHRWRRCPPPWCCPWPLCPP